MKSILVVVDMVNGFINEGALADKNINKITPKIVKLVNKALEQGIQVVAFQDSHSVNDEEFKTFPPHCIAGTNESDLIPELKPFESKMLCIPKNTTNGFITNEFQNILKGNDIKNVYVVGCCTDICVQNFVQSYLDYIKKNNLPTQIKVFEDACATFDSQNHIAEEYHSNSISKMCQNGAIIIKTQKQKEREL